MSKLNHFLYIPRASRGRHYDLWLTFPVSKSLMEIRRWPREHHWQDVQELKGITNTLKESRNLYVILVEDLARFLREKCDDLQEAVAVRPDMTWVSEISRGDFDDIERTRPEVAQWLRDNWEIIRQENPPLLWHKWRLVLYISACLLVIAITGLLLWQTRYNMLNLMKSCWIKLNELRAWCELNKDALLINLASESAIKLISLIFGLGGLWGLVRKLCRKPR